MTAKAATLLRDELEQEIVEGRLRPGERLDEMTLAGRFDVSRTPIREALFGLESSGLVEIIPRRGAFVRKIGVRELIEMFEAMAEMEASCGRFACQRMTQAQEAELRSCFARCDSAAKIGDVDLYYRENEAFHAAIYSASGNEFLRKQALALQSRLKPFRRHQLHARGRLLQSNEEHRAVVEAIAAGDEAVAESTLRGHVVVQGERFNALIASLDAVG